jgi:hypothetical protein
MEVFSKISIVDIPRHFIGPFSDTRWQIHDLCIPEKSFMLPAGLVPRKIAILVAHVDL